MRVPERKQVGWLDERVPPPLPSPPPGRAEQSSEERKREKKRKQEDFPTGHNAARRPPLDRVR